jgi:hypothetical protein
MYLGREELGLRGIFISILIWAGLLLVCMYPVLPSYSFIAVQAVFDIVLLLIIYGGDINITQR